MDTKLIYAAAATSLDSWDIDNLRYIRKISRGQPLQMTDGDTVSYISERGEEDLDSMIPIPSLGMDNFLLRLSDLPDTFPPPGNFNDPSGRVYEKVDNQSLSEECSLVPAPPVPVPIPVPVTGCPPRANNLDDCYLLDIVTVRNESVLAFSSHNYDPLLSPPKPGNKIAKAKNSVESSSAPHSSCSSSSSSAEEQEPVDQLLLIASSDTKSKPERDFFDTPLDNEEEEDTSIELRDDPAGAGSDNQRKISMGGSRDRQCPFCDHPNNKYYNPGPGRNFGDIHAPNNTGEEGPGLLPRSPSPYYVRLRRDLLTAITPPPSNGIIYRRPRNFSVNPQGQLAIDYSSNWLGLENYVSNLKR